MAMVVKNNMSAVNTLNTLNKNSAALAKSLAKVSSGQKINSAADDASGYAISERMKVMIRSLDQANQNAQNGMSMMKVAEGAVSSTVDILKTMKEKAISAANDSNTDSDRAAIQKELDQSIDQIDDNALITYNGKTLVDGSKMAKGSATRTTMTNQSLNEDTTGDTKLVDLKDRNGNGLNIQTTDTLTISYVIQGRNYSLDIDIKDGTTLKSALEDAMQPYTENSPVGSQIYSVYYSSYDLAVSTYNHTVEQATINYNATVAGATTVSTADLQTYVGYYGTNLQEALEAADIAKTNANNVLNTAVSTWNAGAGQYLGTVTAETFGTNVQSSNAYYTASGVQGQQDATHNVQGTTIATNASKTNEIYNNLNSLLSAVKSDASTVAKNEIGSAVVVRDSSIASAEAVRDESLGDLIPYKRTLGNTDYIGKDPAGDSVYTASRENAITITAASAGNKYQLSGITFSVKDSKGQVKKSVNAVLDAFNETIRSANKSNDNAINLQVGTKANQTIRISLTDMRTEALGLKGSDGTTLSVSNQKNANAAINVLDNAIQKALDQQTDIGAVQMRLEMTSANLTTSSQNVQASESTIRDADMAKEMTNFTKNNILLQAAQAMLAQANQSSSSVLSLLQ